MPTVLIKDDWKLEYQHLLKVFKEFNDTFPSGFVDRNRKSGIRCFTGTATTGRTNKLQAIDFWMGIKRNPENGIWTHLYGKYANLSNLNLKVDDNPNNCMYSFEGEPVVKSCSVKWPCGICRVSQSHLLHLKGLCKNDLDFYDDEFYIYGLKNNRPHFK